MSGRSYINIAPFWAAACIITHVIIKNISEANFYSKFCAENCKKSSDNAVEGKLSMYAHEKCTICANRGTSSLHASLVYIITVYYWSCKLSHNVCIVTGEGLESLAMGMMLGYLAYDTVYELLCSTRADALTVVHHILGGMSFLSTYAYSCQACYRFYMIIYLAEVSTPFLHMSWLLNELKLTNTVLFKYCAVTLLILFALFRVCLSPVLLYSFIFSEEVWDQSVYLYALNGLIIFLFMVLNFYWFYLLLRMAFKKQKQEEDKRN